MNDPKFLAMLAEKGRIADQLIEKIAPEESVFMDIELQPLLEMMLLLAGDFEVFMRNFEKDAGVTLFEDGPLSPEELCKVFMDAGTIVEVTPELYKIRAHLVRRAKIALTERLQDE